MQLPDNQLLDTLIALALIYALLSVVVSMLIEYWSSVKQRRGKMLREAIMQLLDDKINKDYGKLLLDSYLIEGLNNKLSNRPTAYISSNLFAEALVDVIAQQSRHTLKIKLPEDASGEPDVNLEIINDERLNDTRAEVMDRFFSGLKEMHASPFRDTMFSMYDKSGQNYDKLKKNIENWYNDYMDRVSGWYKGKIRTSAFVFGLIVAVGLNVNAFHVTKVISLDPQMRMELVNYADSVVSKIEQSGAQSDSISRILLADTSRIKMAEGQQLMPEMIREMRQKQDSSQQNLKQIDSVLGLAAGLNLPIGWSRNTAPMSWFNKSADKKLLENTGNAGLMKYLVQYHYAPTGWTKLSYFAGLLISALLLSVGAPFWFELLVQLVNIRRNGKRPVVKKKPE